MKNPKFEEILKYFGIDSDSTKVMTQEQIIAILRTFYSSINQNESYKMIQIEGLDC